jgi:hypothetical protein
LEKDRKVVVSYSIEIPESLQFYFTNDKNASAIQQIINSETTPIGLTWVEVEQYNTAKVSVLSTQLDFWTLINKIWESSWGRAINSTGFKEISTDLYEDAYSLESVWENKYLFREFLLNGSTVSFVCELTEESAIKLRFYVESESGTYEISNNLPLSPENWLPPDENDNRYTEKSIYLVEHMEIDIEPLTIAADEVVFSLKPLRK